MHSEVSKIGGILLANFERLNIVPYKEVLVRQKSLENPT
jgi:hypothetical protein